MIGTILSNRYKLIAELGNGGMAWVYLAEDLREKRQVAVKVLYPQLSQDIGFLQRFAQEARLAMSLSQSDPEMHVACVLDYGSDRDTHYLVMEYVEGRDLRRLLAEDGALQWQEALDIARQVALALTHAHRHGIVHRDIKSENIMILPDGTARVLDFGVARARTSPSLTHSGFVGSPDYAAPEQAMGRPVDIRADLYSLGVVLCEMLTARLPFEADTPWGVIAHHIATPPPLLEETCPNLPAPVARLVRRMMAKRPEDRFQTPAETVQAIEAMLLGVDLPLEAPATEPGALALLLEGLYQRAQLAVEADRWQEAVDLFSQILKLDPSYRDVTDQLAEAGKQARLSALYGAARRALKSNRWADALAQLDEIAATEPDYQDVRDLRAWVGQKNELDQLYRRGIRHLEAGEWASAIECLAQVHDRDPSHAKAAELLTSARAELARQEQPLTSANRHRAAGDRPVHLHRRSLLWGIVAILIVALVVETYFFYQSHQPPVVAAGSGPNWTAATVVPQFRADPPLPSAEIGGTGLPGTQSTPNPPSTSEMRSPPPSGEGGGPAATEVSATRLPTSMPSHTPRPNATGARTLVPAATRTSLFSGSARPAATTSPSATQWPTTIPTFVPTAPPTRQAVTRIDPPLVGQIAFPRFDPIRGAYDVYACHVNGSNCRRLVPEASQPDLLPDGSQVVVHSWAPDSKGLALWALDGRRVWQITDQEEAARPSVDSQGNVYAYHSRQEVDRLPRLYRTYGAETGSILREASPIAGHSPSWLPSGRIVYGGCLGNDCGIIVTNADGSYPYQVAAGGAETNPEASPDSRQVVFMSRRDGNWEVYLVDIDGDNLRRLTKDPADDGLPTWSPDGQYIAFVSNRGGEWAIWVMRPDGSGQRLLFPLGGPLDGRVRSAASHDTYGWVEERISWGPVP
ncbi:MAG: protein kinase [Anaerolineae bacterium]|nr:protein kinase [Anaerolineae bacterium]